MTKLPPLAQIAKDVGDKVRAMQEDVIQNQLWEEKADDSPVTIADKQANAMIIEALAEAFPNIPVVSEENSPEDNARAVKAKERFDIDPLDNTEAYIQKYDGYSVNIGQLKDGVPVAGAIYFPEREELFFTGEDNKAYLQKGDEAPKRIEVKKLPIRNPVKVAVGFMEQNVGHLDGVDYESESLPGQLRVCKVAQGECDITGMNKGGENGFRSWDSVAPHAVLLAAGGELVTTEGMPMRYGDTTEVQDHIAGAKDTLIVLGLSTPKDLGVGGRSL